MKNYLLLWILLTVLATAALMLVLNGWAELALPGIVILFLATAIAAIIIANELRRPTQKEYYRKKALYPKIPEKYLSDKPESGCIIFGKDYHTNKTVASEIGHHVLIVGSTGSGKTATCLLPSIYNFDENGSYQTTLASSS